ncbi:MAG: 2-C-methyl-D-erythritol 2,4-cyclodiphosphate synthase, partial [Chthoniobacterales bacterium]
HRLVAGRKLILGGVEIPYERGLEGHSDADVLLHAIADALLGAMGEGDIGKHFPNDDEGIRGISSLEILSRVRAILAEKNARATNVDATVVAEAPKLQPHIPEMRKKIAKAIACDVDRVNIKATTNEGMGAVGRGEGMVAFATATVEDV